MVVINKAIQGKDEKRTIDISKDEKHIKMSLNKYDELTVSFSYEEKKGFWFQEVFDVNRGDGELYKAVDGTFASYSGDVFFDTHGANLILLNNDGNYRFLFMEETDYASNEIKCRFYDHSMENDSMKYLFNRLYNKKRVEKEQSLENPKILSKTLQKIVENRTFL